MSSTEVPLKDVLDGLRRHDPRAEELLYSLYAPRILKLAQARLDGRLRAKADPEDLAQSAIKSVFLRLRDGRLRAGAWSDLWPQIIRITMCKLYRMGQRHLLPAGGGPKEDVVGR